MADDVEDLRSHIDAAHAAAERLVREAEERARAAAGEEIPERGWDVPPESRTGADAGIELGTVVALLGSLKEVIPPELSAQLAEAVRELLMAVRALIDWYLDRLEHTAKPGGGAQDRVQDIPIS